MGLLSLENVSMFAVSIKMVIEKLWDMGIKSREVFFFYLHFQVFSFLELKSHVVVIKGF